MGKELAKIFGGVSVTFAVLACLLWATEGIIGYSLGDRPLWRSIAGVAVWLCVSTFWIYMWTHAWHD